MKSEWLVRKLCFLSVIVWISLTMSSALAQPPNMVKVLIGFDIQPGPTEEALVHGKGGIVKYTYHLVPAIAATLPAQAREGLLRNPLGSTVLSYNPGKHEHSGSIDGLSSKPFRVEVVSSGGGSDNVEGTEIGSK